jgi:hypothetical protein
MTALLKRSVRRGPFADGAKRILVSVDHPLGEGRCCTAAPRSRAEQRRAAREDRARQRRRLLSL